jgi:hypothetical protein
MQRAAPHPAGTATQRRSLALAATKALGVLKSDPEKARDSRTENNSRRKNRKMKTVNKPA